MSREVIDLHEGMNSKYGCGTKDPDSDGIKEYFGKNYRTGFKDAKGVPTQPCKCVMKHAFDPKKGENLNCNGNHHAMVPDLNKVRSHHA